VQAGNGPLVLRGILLAQPRTASTALISIGDAAPIAFRAGQAVGNATVDAIAIDHVVLASGATRTILGFPDPAQRTAPASPPADRAPPNAPALPVIASSANGPAMLERFGATLSGAGLAVSNPSAVMRLAGLQAGDQIVAINGTPASAVAHNPGLLQPILAAGSARIDIVRAGERMTISVPVR
jgi:general secretion pathway protein C